MKRRIVLLLLVVVLLIAATASCAPKGDKLTSDFWVKGRNFQKLNGWIYYFDYEMEKLWRVKENGEEKVQIFDGDRIFFEVCGDKIFYTADYADILSSMRIDGSDKKTILDLDNEEIRALKFEVVDDWIYVLTHNYKLLKIKTDGTQTIEFTETAEWFLDFSIEGGWIYFSVHQKPYLLGIGQLHRMRTNGTQRQKLMQEVSFSIDYADDWIYYIDMDDSDIYAVTFYGTEKREIAQSDGGYFLKVIGDWVYYNDLGDVPGLYKAKRDGSESKLITSDFEVSSFEIWDNWLLCFGSDSISAIKVSENNDTDEIIGEILSEWTNVEIYE